LAEFKARIQTGSFDMSELRGLCNEIILEQEFKVKVEKTEYAICYLEEL